MVATLPAVALRAWEAKDDPHLSAWLAHSDVREYLAPSLRGVNLNPDATLAWLPTEPVGGEHVFAVCAPERDGQGPIGMLSLRWTSRDSVELALVIGEPELWNRGYGRAATRAAVEHAFAERRCGRVLVRVHPDNERALACFRAVGFDQGPRGGKHVWLVLTRTTWSRRGAGGEASA